jgi:quinol monooxygenase YgiN
MPEDIHVLTHIDLIPPHAEAGMEAIEKYAAELGSAPGVKSLQVLQQYYRKNHVELLIVFESLEAYEANLGAPFTLAFREQLHPLIGAPFDDRLHILVGAGS